MPTVNSLLKTWESTMSRSLLKMKSNSPSNAEKTNEITTRDQNHQTLQLSCDAIQLSLSLIGSASHSFAVIPSLSCLTTILSIDKADLLGDLKRLVMRSFWFTANNPAKGPSFLHFQFTCIQIEQMRFSILIYFVLFPDKRSERM